MSFDKLIKRNLPSVERALVQQELDVLAITASSFITSEHWTFCHTRANPGLQP